MARGSKSGTHLPHNFDGSKKCWNCSSTQLAVVDDHYKCGSCGATWNHVDRVGKDELVGFSSPEQYLKALAHGNRKDFAPLPGMMQEP